MKNYELLNLEEITPIRFFKGDKKERAYYMNCFKLRWHNDSHFVRSAVQYFMRHLDLEMAQMARDKKTQKRR